jgi:hypothetical protein
VTIVTDRQWENIERGARENIGREGRKNIERGAKESIERGARKNIGREAGENIEIDYLESGSGRKLKKYRRGNYRGNVGEMANVHNGELGRMGRHADGRGEW